MARFSARNLLHDIARRITGAASGHDLEQMAKEILDSIDARWQDYLDDPKLGFGNASPPGVKGQINYTGEARRNIVSTRPTPFHLDIQENHPRLEQIRMGTAPTRVFNRDAYVWAWQKVYGRSGEPTPGRAARGSPAAQAKRDARRLALAVMFKGTSSEYARSRFHGPTGSPRGFDYPGQFLALYDKAIDAEALLIAQKYGERIALSITNFT